jgi:phosphoglycerol transferase MdoB-like AlkP superfamily enzyme
MEIGVFFSSLPNWVLAVLVVVALILAAAINNQITDRFRSHFPWLFRPKALLAIFALCVVVTALGLWINPPSKVREKFRQAHPELVLKPASPSPIHDN